MAFIKRQIGWHHLILLGILILAAVLRFYRLEEMPVGFYHDEAYNGLDALALNEGLTFPIFHEGWEVYSVEAFAERPPAETLTPIFFEGNYGREPVHVYLMALSVWLFGPTSFAIRAVPAAAGVLSVLTVYWVTPLFLSVLRLPSQAKSENGRWPLAIMLPLFAAFVMAAMFPAVHFSRYALRMMIFVPAEVFCVYFFWQGIESYKKENRHLEMKNWFVQAYWYFILSGVLLGAGLYIYSAGRLFPFLFAIFVPIWFLLEKDAWRKFWRPIGIMAAVSAIVVAPLLLYFWRYPYFLFVRAAYVLENGTGVIEGRPWLTRWYNLGRVMRGILFYGEESFRHNLPGRPFLDVIQSFLFTIGSLRMLRACFGKMTQPEKPQGQLKSIFLVLWFLSMIAPTVLSSSAPHFGRMTGAMPVLAIIVALGLGQVWLLADHWIAEKRYQPSARVALFGLCLVGIGLSTFWTVRDYFVVYAELPLMQELFDQGDWEAGQVMNELADDYELYLSPPQAKFATLYFALGIDRTQLRNFNGAESLVPIGREDKGSAYFIRNDDEASLQRLREFFPNGRVLPPLQKYTPFIVENPTNVLHEPLQASFEFGQEIDLYDWYMEKDNGQISVTLVWQGVSSMTRDYTVFIHLLDMNGEIVAQLDRPPAGYPTSDWHPNEFVVDQFTIPIPEGVMVESIRTGFYFLPTLEALGSPAQFDVNIGEGS